MGECYNCGYHTGQLFRVLSKSGHLVSVCETCATLGLDWEWRDDEDEDDDDL